MKKLIINILLCMFMTTLLTQIAYSQQEHQAIWAQTVIEGTNRSIFQSVAVDTSGNVFAAGFQTGREIFTYGLGVSIQGSPRSNNSDSAVLVKYDSNGIAQWARTVSGGDQSRFYSVAVDVSGNVYVVGTQDGTSIYTYGHGVRVQGMSPLGIGTNAVLVKYDSNGVAQWARTPSGGGDTVTAGRTSRLFSLSVDSSGNVYVAGQQWGTDIFNWGNEVSIQGTNAAGNAVLVKYNSDGIAHWARTYRTWRFSSVTVDALGNVYSAGNNVLLKYNSDGIILWARTVDMDEDSLSGFNSIAIDNSGNIYAVATLEGHNIYTYGSGVSVQGTARWNAVLVKYNSDGIVQWAQIINNGGLNSVVVDVLRGYLYIAGTNWVAVLAEYNFDGIEQWTQIASGGINSGFNSVVVDDFGNVYVAGSQNGTYTFIYGAGVSAQGTFSNDGVFRGNAVLVKYSIND
jgi:hypothetical protein